MTKYFCEGLWRKGRWQAKVLVETNDQGLVESISHLEQAPNNSIKLGFVCPGFQNTHSHSFQYLMAGFTEKHRSNKQDFWSWRERMYALANAIRPDDLYEITKLCYQNMLRKGYLSVCEFHYLHFHEPNKHLKIQESFAAAIINAAKDVGINLNLVPVYYESSEFDKPALEEQQRFVFSDVRAYAKYIHRLHALENRFCKIGHGVHSVRATMPQTVKTILNSRELPGRKHLHISEQKQEVDRFYNRFQKTPISWFLENITEPCNLIHATHLEDGEITKLAKSIHHVVLCPTTEANLGDGIFPLQRYHREGGSWSIASDSNVVIEPGSELALIDYSQRWLSNSRCPLALHNSKDFSEADIMYEHITREAERASGFDTSVEIGSYLNILSFNSQHPLLADSSHRLNQIIFNPKENYLTDVVINGQHKKIANLGEDWLILKKLTDKYKNLLY